MRVLLINSNRKSDLLAAPPLGLCYVAAAASAAGHEVQVLDLCFGGRVGRRVARTVGAFAPRVVGLSVRNLDNCNLLHPVSYLPEVARIAAQIRAASAAPLVLGGAAAALCPEPLLRRLQADYVIVADGEEAFVRLLQALEGGAPAELIPGVGLLREGRFHLTPPRLNGFPAERPGLGHWLELRPYRRRGSSYSLQSKRGCRQRCIYCTYNQVLEGAGVRLRPPREVVDEIEEAVYRYRPPLFEFVDAVFNDPWEHSVEILEEILRRPWRARFTAMGLRPRHLDAPYPELLWRAGFRSLMLTPESASDLMLRSYRKGFGRSEVIKAAECLSRTPFTTWWYFLIGGPGETNATLQESLDFAERQLPRSPGAGVHLAHFFLGVRLYPGTELWDLALREGLVTPATDPLMGTWYLSSQLDLEQGVRQIMTAAGRCPRIYTGFDERKLAFSRLFTLGLRLLGRPGPYWRYFRGERSWGLTGRRFRASPEEVARRLETALQRQREISRKDAKAQSQGANI